MNVNGIIHVGAHYGGEDGKEVKEYVNLGIKDIFLFEPLKSNFQILQQNVSKIDADIKLHQVALGNERKKVTMNLSSNDNQSSSILNPKVHLNAHPEVTFSGQEEVEMKKLDDYLITSCNMMVIDVQGYELEVFKGASETLKNIDYIYCEVNQDEVYENNARVEDLDDYLSQYSFKRVETHWYYTQVWGDAIYIKTKKRSMNDNFSKLVIDNGGSIHPLIIPSDDLKGPAITNPSIYVDGDVVRVNLRNINYTLYHSEKRIFEHHWGPLVYIHPENDLRLRTWNIMCELNDEMKITKYNHIDTSSFPDKELWEFVGLEDCRIVRWDGKLYVCGVRRDLDTIGTGRMELSELEITENGVKEVAQYRIPTPGDDSSYCEKNWMPIVDMPFHFVKWTNGTEVVKYDIETGTTTQAYLSDWKDLGCIDLRGGSQVIPLNEKYRFCLNHETYLTKSDAGRKDGIYKHRFIVWDENWNIVKVSRQFSFLNANIEFAVGMCEYKDDYLITFGFQDNAAYLLRAPKQLVKDFIFN